MVSTPISLQPQVSKEVVVQNIDAWAMLNEDKNSTMSSNHQLNDVQLCEKILSSDQGIPHNSSTQYNQSFLGGAQIGHFGPPKTTSPDVTIETNLCKAVGNDFVWNDFRNRKALVDQREREIKEQEALKLQQMRQKQEEERKLFEEEVNEKRRVEEENIRLAKVQQEQEMMQRREAERIRRQEMAGSVNLMSQFDMMADFEKNMK
eukprot:TRINITY_DN3073_c0_g1_i40.p1 TRINITY_DN3073_c0_g1~~TRINITY_DN3073_c0_g1_i40.p1  ORF type:complete len:205 (-),score=52.80 TRINITY_DN3073_c0_g1_i40:78-692(-)